MMKPPAAPRLPLVVHRAFAAAVAQALGVFLAMTQAAPSAEAQPADLLFRGGPVHTALLSDTPSTTVSDHVSDTPGAQPPTALAVTGDTISWLGSADDAAPWIGPDTQIIELDGRPLLPGFADGHIHLEAYGATLAQVDLVGTSSYGDVIAAVVERAKSTPKGTWITGRGWDQNDWVVTELPHHRALSDAVQDHPVLIKRIGGHAVLVNQQAMDVAGMSLDARSPEGGLIHRDKQQRPTGVLVDNAIGLVASAMPDVPLIERRQRVVAAIKALHTQGITSVHDAGVDGEAVAVFADLARAGEFSLRSHVMIAANEPLLRAPKSDTGWPTSDLTGQGLIAVRAIKLVADGALGSRGAAMLRDYSDDHVQGLVRSNPEQTLEMAQFAVANGWQLCTHAIGDRANREVLDAYSLALAPLGPLEARAAHRFRIEHAQILSPSDIPRFAELGVIPSMQAQHLTSDMPWAEERIGPIRILGAYAWRDLIDSGVIIPGGSDCPVERADPMAAFCAAVTRRDKGGQPPSGWYPEQAMTRDEALAYLTLWPAMAAFDEHRLGSLQPGKLADLVVLSGDLMTAPSEELGALHVDYTVFNGQVVFDRARN